MDINSAARSLSSDDPEVGASHALTRPPCAAENQHPLPPNRRAPPPFAADLPPSENVATTPAVPPPYRNAPYSRDSPSATHWLRPKRTSGNSTTHTPTAPRITLPPTDCARCTRPN